MIPGELVLEARRRTPGSSALLSLAASESEVVETLIEGHVQVGAVHGEAVHRAGLTPGEHKVERNTK